MTVYITLNLIFDHEHENLFYNFNLILKPKPKTDILKNIFTQLKLINIQIIDIYQFVIIFILHRKFEFDF